MVVDEEINANISKRQTLANYDSRCSFTLELQASGIGPFLRGSPGASESNEWYSVNQNQELGKEIRECIHVFGNDDCGGGGKDNENVTTTTKPTTLNNNI
jgi:hypothetical protein